MPKASRTVAALSPAGRCAYSVGESVAANLKFKRRRYREKLLFRAMLSLREKALLLSAKPVQNLQELSRA